MYLRLLITLFFIFSLGTFLQPAAVWADDLMMDQDNPYYTAISGNWSVSSWAPCATGGAYYYAWGSDDSITLETEQTADITGEYAVYARWTSHANRNMDARYRIYDGASLLEATEYRDQRENGCSWNYLATVMLTQGNKGRVILDNPGATSGEATIIDAIRFVRVSNDGDTILDGTVTSLKIADGEVASTDVGFNYADSSSKGGPALNALDLNCTGCVSQSELDFTAPADGDWTISGNDMYSTVSGNVGIGTTSPGALLEVASGTLSTQFTGNDIRFNRDGRAYISNVNTGASSSLAFTTQAASSNVRMLIAANGNVGIGTGTASPESKLDVRSQSSLSVGAIRAENSGSSGNAIYAFASHGSGNNKAIYAVTTSPNGRAGYFQNFNGTAAEFRGNVGIGTGNPGTTLDVAGTVRVAILQITSDKKYKKNIETIDSALEKVSRLRGVTFEWRKDEFTDKGFEDGRKMGLIAQEVEEVLPEIVSTASTDSSKSVEYSNLVAVLIEAVKELKSNNDELQQRIETLERLN